ncbi:YtxH domain-containing protein [Bacillus sp. V3B]|uniref:YtxH domain-containing protein n=1 Tax=Bacillus sp. V3B TaxID=2804915 RepID=UPI00210B516A|nr:YtxH domain-containing protein [Bacillus sp. V3B]MCQ6275204.1 YtxH domain-containing protein [Bacillus sp. V3B]
MSNTKFWKGVVLGAIAGGALSLLDRTTRYTVIGNCQKTTGKMKYYAKHPQEAVNCVKESTRKICSTMEEVGEEIAFISEKIEELKEIKPQVADLVKDTKEVFVESPDNENEDESDVKATMIPNS